MNERKPRSAGDIDDLLTDFFTAAQPKPWPRLPLPDSEARELMSAAPRPMPRSKSPGRFALAASIAFLALASMWLVGHAPKAFNGPNLTLEGSNADLKTKPK